MFFESLANINVSFTISFFFDSRLERGLNFDSDVAKNVTTLVQKLIKIPVLFTNENQVFEQDLLLRKYQN